MAERRQRKLSCQLHSLADRHATQKLAQVYRWLVPEGQEQPSTQKVSLSTCKDEKNSRHLR